MRIRVPQAARAGDILKVTYHDTLLTINSVELLSQHLVVQPANLDWRQMLPQSGVGGSSSNLPPGAELAAPSRGPPSRGKMPKYIFLDLENLAFLAINLLHLHLRCRDFDVEFRAYSSPEFEWADRATHHSKSNLKEAADVRMVVDASRLTAASKCRILIITDDERFGATLAAEEADIERVAYDELLPTSWKGTVFGALHRTVAEFFASLDVVRERRGRSATQSSRSRSQSRGRSLSRDCSRDRSPSREPSVSRVSWTRVGSHHSGGSDAGNRATGSSNKQNKSVNHLIEKIDSMRSQMEDLQIENDLLKQSHRLEGGGKGAGKGGGNGRGGGKGGGGKGGGGKGGGGRGGGKGSDDRPMDPKGSRPRQWPNGQAATPGKHIGTVRRFDPVKGYGFIHVDGVERDVFVHRTCIVCEGEPDERLRHWDVEMRLVPDRKYAERWRAEEVSGPNGRAIPL